MHSIDTSLSYDHKIVLPPTDPSKWKALTPYLGPSKLLLTSLIGAYELNDSMDINNFLNFRAFNVINGEPSDSSIRQPFRDHVNQLRKSRDTSLAIRSQCTIVSLICGIGHLLVVSLGNKDSKTGLFLQALGNQAILINNMAAIFHETSLLIAVMEESKCYEEDDLHPLHPLMDAHKFSSCLGLVHSFESIAGIVLSIFEIGNVPITVITTFTRTVKIVYDLKLRKEFNKLVKSGIIVPTKDFKRNLIGEFDSVADQDEKKNHNVYLFNK